MSLNLRRAGSGRRGDEVVGADVTAGYRVLEKHIVGESLLDALALRSGGRVVLSLSSAATFSGKVGIHFDNNDWGYIASVQGGVNAKPCAPMP